jgi:FLVCR family MFS transporter 7
MRPLRMKAMGRAKKPAEGANGAVTERRSGGEEREGDNRDLKGITTNGTASSAGDLEGLTEMTSNDELLDDGEGRTPRDGGAAEDAAAATSTTVYKVYKRRWFGLVQLVLLNIIVSWDVSQQGHAITRRLHTAY